MDELVEYLRDDKGREKCKAMTDHFPCSKDCPCALELRVISDAARIEALEQDLKAVLRREEDANRAAMKHLRALEQERIKSKNYADFNHEWRRRCEALERQVKAADALAEAVDDFGNLKPTDSSIQWGLRLSRCLSELAAYRAAKEGGA